MTTMTTDRRIKRICPFNPRNLLSHLTREYPFNPEIRCHIPGPPQKPL
ncbi:hypothetical protein QUF72_09740 [Desulfobacterales bacterium HSG2]|nr:hypothetical protein [Desulfobacterales bacterium HSG2]